MASAFLGSDLASFCASWTLADSAAAIVRGVVARVGGVFVDGDGWAARAVGKRYGVDEGGMVVVEMVFVSLDEADTLKQ